MAIDMELIKGEKFILLGDYVYNIKTEYDEYYNLKNTFDINKIKNNDVVYTHTHMVKYFFDEIKKTDKKIILISHNSDVNINNNYNIPKNIIKWYSQNVNINDNRINSIPIGLENSIWFKNIQKEDKIKYKITEQKNIKNLLYMNHNVNTNRVERLKPYELFRNKKWVTSEIGKNGQNFDNYLDNVYNHKFVLCPEGNGIDTHRTWECLYLNTIPIEKRNINNQHYIDLPICFVDNWEEITENFLLNEYERIQNTKYNMEKLNFEYWKNKIKN